MSMKLSRRSTLGLMAGAATLAVPNVVRAQTVEVVAHYSMPPIFKAAQEAVAEAFNKQSSRVKVTYANPTPNYEDGAQLILRQATSAACQTCPSRVSTACVSSPSAALPPT